MHLQLAFQEYCAPGEAFAMRAILHHPESSLAIIRKPEISLVQQRSAKRQHSGVLTLACDMSFLLATIGAGLILNVLVAAVLPSSSGSLERAIIEWLPFWLITLIAGGFLLRDCLRCLNRTNVMPFDCTDLMVQHIYQQRLEMIVWAISAHFVLLCLCMLMPTQPFFSNLFLSSVIALVALAVRQSIPAQKLAFAASTGIFSLAMLVIGIAGALIH